jgi:TP901 family phage tail tape measure protein
MNVSLIFTAINRISAPLRGMRTEVNAGTAAFDKNSEALKRNKLAAERLEAAHEQLQSRMQMAAQLSLVASNMDRVAASARGMVSSSIDALRPGEKAIGELATLGVKNLEMMTQEGRKIQRELAGITASSFIFAAYDIKSGISTLTDEGVAAMTSAAVRTAKATKAPADQMTSLFATAYGTFKQLDNDMSDADWGNKFSAGLSAAVQQFKTTGSGMQMAIESAGSEASLLGMALEDQLTTLGMLQQKMKSEQAGTAFKSFTANAGKANAYFEKMGMNIRTLDENGKMRGMADILADIRNEFGPDYNAGIGIALQNAFGDREAGKVVQGLWNQADAFKANARAIADAQSEGMKFTNAMAKLADQNLDSRLQLFAQRWDLLRQQMGEKFAPILEPILGMLGGIMDRFSEWMDKHPKLAGAVAGLVFGLAGLATALSGVFSVASGVIGTFAMASYGMKFLRYDAHFATRSFRTLGMAILNAGKNILGFAFSALRQGAIALWGFATTAIPAAIAGLSSMAVAAWTAMAPFLPFIAAVGLVAGAAFLVVKYWEPIKGFFAGLWDGIKTGISKMWGLVKTVFAWSPMGLLLKAWAHPLEFINGVWEKIKAVGQFLGIGGGDVTSAAQGNSAPRTNALKPALASVGVAAAIAASPPIAANAAGAGSRMTNNTVNAPITINQQPGQSSEDLAEQIGRELDARQRQADAEQRGALYDG